MTVAELITNLLDYPMDAEVVIPNEDTYINGEYVVTDVMPFIDGTIEIVTNYDKRIDEEDG